MADIRQKAAENKAIQAFCAKYNKITSHINFPTESSKYSFIVFMIAALAAFFISVNARYDQFYVWKQNKEQFFYENTPMMTTLDAYKYTRHAKELKRDKRLISKLHKKSAILLVWILIKCSK